MILLAYKKVVLARFDMKLLAVWLDMCETVEIEVF